MRNTGALFDSLQLDEEFEDTYDKEVGSNNRNPKKSHEIEEEQVPLIIPRP